MNVLPMESGCAPLPIPLYHGTSTIFIDDILGLGLGGRDPIATWKVLELAKAMHPLVVEHFSQDDGWMLKAQSFGFMVEQKSAAMNFQHGQTYLSPSRSTAVRYAVSKRFGSELLTYTLDFLEELARRNVPGVRDDLYRKYPDVFGILNTSCAPLLVSVDAASQDELLAESGADAEGMYAHVLSILSEHGEEANVLLQQSNFRLKRPIPVSRLKIWLINVTQYHPIFPEYSLHQVSTAGPLKMGEK